MNSKKISTKVKKVFPKVALVSALVGGLGYTHARHPTTFPSIYYMVTDPFVATLTEKKIEEQFGIDYEGDSSEERQKELEENLQNIYETNPALLAHCKKIVLHSEAVQNSRLVKPFLSYGGYSDIGDTINIIDNSLDTLAHELAHLAHYNSPKKFDEELDHIFGNTYKKGLKKENRRSLWNDNSFEPRDGFVKPYGATNASENVATYVEKAYDPSFWEDERLQQSDKYLQTLSLLQKYNFISPKQFEEIKETLENNTPLKKQIRSLEFEHLIQELQKLIKP